MSINCIIYLFRTNTWCSFLNVIRISLGVSLERNNIIFQLRLTLVQDMVTYSSPIWTKMYVENGFSLIRSAGCESKQSHSIQIRMLNSMHRVGRMTIYLHGVLLGSLLSGLLHESFCPIQYFFYKQLVFFIARLSSWMTDCAYPTDMIYFPIINVLSCI